MTHFFAARLMLLTTGAAVTLAASAKLRAEPSYEPYVACYVRIKDVVYVSPASKWGGSVKEGSLANSRPYLHAWNRAIATVGGDWRDSSNCETGNSRAETGVKIRERAMRGWTDTPRLEPLGWDLEPGYKAPSTPPKPATSQGALIVEDTGMATHAKAWDDQVLQAKREEAARAVKTVLANAQEKARSEAIFRKMLGEMRKRGRAQ